MKWSHVHEPTEQFLYNCADDTRALTIMGSDADDNQAITSIYGTATQMWDIATTIVDALIEVEFTQEEIEFLDSLSARLGFVVQDWEVCNAS